MQRFCWLLVLVVLVTTNLLEVDSVSSTATASKLGALKASFTTKGIEYIKGVALEVLTNKLQTIQIPDQSGTYDVPVIPTIDYTVSNIKFNSLQLLANYTSATVDTNGLSVRVTNMAAELSCVFNYRERIWPHISGSPAALVTFSSSSISALVSFNSTSDGHLVAQPQSVTVSFDQMHIQLDGGFANWLFDIVQALFGGPIKNLVQGAVAGGTSSAIANNLNAALATVPLQQPITSDIELDYSLVGPPALTKQYLGFTGQGVFLETSRSRRPPPFEPTQQLPDSVNPGFMLQALLGDYIINSALWAFYDMGMMKYNITDGSIPSTFPFRFKTDTFKLFVPALYEAYPGLFMEGVFDVTSRPIAYISSASEGIHVQAQSQVIFYVLKADGSNVQVFTLQINVNVTGKAHLNAESITGELTDSSLNMTLIESSIGTFDPNGLNWIISAFVQKVLFPNLNEKLQSGFELPSVAGIKFVNAVVTYVDGFVAVNTDVTYSPTYATAVLEQRHMRYLKLRAKY